MSFRNAFQKYIDNPDSCLELLLYNDENVLIIKDAFPKALRHYLIIPKSPNKTHVHPLLVFQNDPQFYTLIENYVKKTKQLIIDDLFGSGLLKFDKADTLATQEFMNRFLKAGVHSIPSLSNLHVHVITQDFYSSRLKHKKHYNSFTTKFFVEFTRLEPPQIECGDQLGHGYDSSSSYSSDEPLRTPFISTRHEMDPAKLQGVIAKSPLKCTYCGATFGNRFVHLKKHLQDEFARQFAVSPNESETKIN